MAGSVPANPANLHAILMNTDLQTKNNPLYQVLHSLINAVAAPTTSGGTVGATGATGPTGNTGAIGPTGATGALGPIGMTMILEDGIDGIDGFPGTQGLQGIAGTQGVAGSVGPLMINEDGIDGDIGPPGVQGVQGITGVHGPTGLPLIFEDGIDGLDGWTIPVRGLTGNIGLSGNPGLDGIDGDDNNIISIPLWNTPTSFAPGSVVFVGTNGVLTGNGKFNRATAQIAANASVATYTVGVADGSFRVSANVLVTASVTHSFTVTCAYTDEGGTVRTLTLSFSQVTGAFITAITNVLGVGAYEGVTLHIRCKASTAITIATTGTFTSVTYNVEASIIQIA